MKMKIKSSLVILLTALGFLVVTSSVAAVVYSYHDKAKKYLDSWCSQGQYTYSSGVNAVLCSFRDRITALESMVESTVSRTEILENAVESSNNRIDVLETAVATPIDTGKRILDYGQVRCAGAFPQPEPNITVPTNERVTVNCNRACVLWVNYDVDTRNSELSPIPNGWSHLYHIFVDSVNQAVYNQASFPVPNVAVPLAVNGVFPVAAGEHVVEIYVRKNGGTLE